MRVSKSVWCPLDRPALGPMNILSGMFASLEARRPGSFPDLRSAECLLVASDYGGEHNTADFQTLAFLTTDMRTAAAWQPERERIRKHFLPDGRRMAFKNLDEGFRRRALGPFLESANRLPALLSLFVISKAVASLFRKEGKLDAESLEVDFLQKLSPATAEKLLSVTHFVSLLLSGLSAPGQDVLWVTDEDAIAANAGRVRGLVDTLAIVSSHYLPHTMRHLRVTTSAQDMGDQSSEDLLAIPDIAAGALTEVLTASCVDGGAPMNGMWLPPPASISLKARSVMNWFADHQQPLRRVVIMLDEEPNSHALRMTLLQFHGSRI